MGSPANLFWPHYGLVHRLDRSHCPLSAVAENCPRDSARLCFNFPTCPQNLTEGENVAITIQRLRKLIVEDGDKGKSENDNSWASMQRILAAMASGKGTTGDLEMGAT